MFIHTRTCTHTHAHTPTHTHTHTHQTEQKWQNNMMYTNQMDGQPLALTPGSLQSEILRRLLQKSFGCDYKPRSPMCIHKRKAHIHMLKILAVVHVIHKRKAHIHMLKILAVVHVIHKRKAHIHMLKILGVVHVRVGWIRETPKLPSMHWKCQSPQNAEAGHYRLWKKGTLFTRKKTAQLDRTAWLWVKRESGQRIRWMLDSILSWAESISWLHVLLVAFDVQHSAFPRTQKSCQGLQVCAGSNGILLKVSTAAPVTVGSEAMDNCCLPAVWRQVKITTRSLAQCTKLF